MPSLTYETFGIVVIEAFSHGTPAVARRLGPLPEVIERGGGGLLFEDTDGLDRAMRSLVEDPQMRQRLAAEAAASFRANFSEEAVMPQLLGIIERARLRVDASGRRRTAAYA
jgi:glycosyltransferase involved in cell wall biosynthesis